jgi:chromosome partitioning protein
LNIFAIANRQPNSGKTALVVELSTCLARDHRVLLVDLDGQAARMLRGIPAGAPFGMLAITPSRVANLDVATIKLPAQADPFALAEALAGVPGYDVALIDVPSGGQQERQCLAAAHEVIVVMPDRVHSLDDLSTQVQAVYRATAGLNPGLRLRGVIPTFVTGPGARLNSALVQLFGAERVLPAFPQSNVLAKAHLEGRTLGQVAPHTHAARAGARIAAALAIPHRPRPLAPWRAVAQGDHARRSPA